MKKAKNRVFGPKKPVFSRIFLSGIGGYPPPLNGKSSCPKTLSGKGGYSPPLTKKIRLIVFEGLPIYVLPYMCNHIHPHHLQHPPHPLGAKIFVLFFFFSSSSLPSSSSSSSSTSSSTSSSSPGCNQQYVRNGSVSKVP